MIRTAPTVLAGAVAATVLAVLPALPSAAAIPPPRADPAALPTDPDPRPGPVQQRGECSVTGLMAGTDVAEPSAAQQLLDLPRAWQFSRGAGQTVAVIDTGVTPGPRLPNVDGGGDYLGATDGLLDCDGHGTAVAGLIAGQPGPDGFSGVAPDARVLAIRQTSTKFGPRAAGADPAADRTAIDVGSLARAVVHAADLGARVINISAITCLPADETVDQAALGAALRYAAIDRDAVVVAAAGNIGAALAGGNCAENPLGGASRPGDTRDWAGVTSVSIPSWWQPYVLSVGSLTGQGRPSEFTMAGPWVGIGGPGEDIVSVSNAPGGGLADGTPDNDGRLVGIAGTSFAAAYVSGVAALVRSHLPQLSAAQVVDRLTRTARNTARAPSNLTGAGTVDAVAALTWQIPTDADLAAVAQRDPVAAPPAPRAADTTPLLVAFGGIAVLAAVGAAAAVTLRRRKDRSA